MTAIQPINAVLAAIQEIFLERDMPALREWVYPGELIVLPEIGDHDCAVLFASLFEAFGTDNFPEVSTSGCSSRPAYTLRFGVARCAIVSSADGRFEPELDDVRAMTADAMLDLEIVREGICRGLAGSWDWRLGRYAPVGPEGGIIGGYWSVTVDSMRDD